MNDEQCPARPARTAVDHRPAEERHAAKRLDNNIPPMRSVIAPLRARAHLEGLGRGRGGEGDEHDHALH